jgi:prepilin peptidase CpaA
MSLAHLVAIAIAAMACVTDLRSRRIPNALTFGGAAAALVFHTVRTGGDGLLTSLAGWGLGVACFLLPFALGGLGGGDIKLVATLGAWLGPALTIWMAMYTGVAGGVVALVVALSRGYLKQALANIRTANVASLAESREPGLAYAPPIFVGTVVALWLQS